MNQHKSGRNGPDRRQFIKQAVTAGFVGPGRILSNDGKSADGPGKTPPGSKTNAGIEFPRIFEGSALNMIAFPLGGVGTGSISLGGRGELKDWEIFNRPDKGHSPAYCFASLWLRDSKQKSIARILEARFSPPYERGPSGLGSDNLPGLPRFAHARFIGEFPFAAIEFGDDDLPVQVRLEAFNPFIPLDPEATSLPVAILRYIVKNPGPSSIPVSIALSIDNPVGRAGRTGEYREAHELKGIFMNNPAADQLDPLRGSFVLGVTPDSGELSYLLGWRGYGFWVPPNTFWKDFSEDGMLDPKLHPEPNKTASLCLRQSIAPSDAGAFTFLLAWHFPNRTPERCGWTAPKGEEKTIIGNHYTQRFMDAWEAAQYAAAHLPELENSSREFLQTMKATTLPPAVLDAAMSNLSTLHTNTCFQTADGRFHGFEGSGNQSGCCFGSCTHVWNYEAVLASLFPSYSRSLRELSLGFCTDEEGRMDFRYFLPYGKQAFGMAAADGQMGSLMKFHLDWKLSGSDDWLRTWWPKFRKALEFAWIPGGWDADRDGVMEGAQHTTFDVEFYGPNPLCTIWYLGALRAGEEVARAAGDEAAANEYRRVYEKGSSWVDANLFNGDFYIQRVQGRPTSQIAKGLLIGEGSRDTEDPDFQMGEGCLTDQLVGQYFAHLAGLGDLLDTSNVRRALQSIFRNNFRKSLADHQSFARVFALNDEKGVIVCDYANRPRRPLNLTSSPEIFSGSEYQLAAHMFFEGMHSEALEIVESIRRRHDGERRNPWNELECGHHYARALAAWSCVLALSGFGYEAGKEEVTLAPRMGGNVVRGFWCVPTGWGFFEKETSASSLELRISPTRGRLTCRQIRLPSLSTVPRSASVQLKSTPVNADIRVEGKDLLIQMSGSQVISRENPLHVVLD